MEGKTALKRKGAATAFFNVKLIKCAKKLACHLAFLFSGKTFDNMMSHLFMYQHCQDIWKLFQKNRPYLFLIKICLKMQFVVPMMNESFLTQLSIDVVANFKYATIDAIMDNFRYFIFVSGKICNLTKIANLIWQFQRWITKIVNWVRKYLRNNI